MKLKISELGKVITGNTPSKKIKEFWDKDDVGFVKPDIISDEHIVKIKSEDCNEFISNAAISKARIVPKNSIFVTCIGNIGKVGVATENLAFNQQINAIMPNENVNLDYLCYAIFANKTRLQDIANAPIVPLLNKSQFSEFELEFDMDINTQTRIVNELNTVSNIILKYKQELLLLDELVRARFVEMFGDPVTNPKGWETTSIGDECYYIKDGPHKSLPDIGRDNGGHPFISVRNIVNGYIDFSDARYISDEDYYDSIKKCHPEKGDMLYSKGGTTGIAKLIDIDEPFANWVHVAVLKFDKFRLNGIFFENMLNGDYCYSQSQRLTKGIANRDLVLSAMAQIKLYCPPLELQNQFASFVEEIDKSRLLSNHSLFLIKSITF